MVRTNICQGLIRKLNIYIIHSSLLTRWGLGADCRCLGDAQSCGHRHKYCYRYDDIKRHHISSIHNNISTVKLYINTLNIYIIHSSLLTRWGLGTDCRCLGDAQSCGHRHKYCYRYDDIGRQYNGSIHNNISTVKLYINTLNIYIIHSSLLTRWGLGADLLLYFVV